MENFAGKVALVTGGGTGIGAAVAEQFCAAGGRVVLMGRREEPLRAAASRLDALVAVGDAASTDDVKSALRLAQEHFGGLDVLVANAGGHGIGNVLGTDDNSWRLSTRLNLDTAFVCTRELMPELIRRQGY